jgi:hypothetical protein
MFCSISACIGQPINSTVSEMVVAQPGCVAAPIVSFTTTSPKGLTKSAIVYDSSARKFLLIVVMTDLKLN